MSTILHQLRRAFADTIRLQFGLEIDPSVVPATQEQFGDYQCNVAMSLSKQIGATPRDVAQKIVDHLKIENLVSKLDIAGPGFINIFLSPACLNDAINTTLTDPRLGVAAASDKQRVVVDYSGPNVAKEMLIGHLRSTIIGDAVARVLAFLGHDVVRQNHLGDWGTQFGRVMLGLWYDAAALHDHKPNLLSDWATRLKALPKKADKESPEQLAARMNAQRELLRDVHMHHQAWVNLDPDGKLFFEPFIQNAFPALPRLQELYQLASGLTDLDAAVEFTIVHPSYGEKTLATLPSLFATFVQQQDSPQHYQEGIAWKKSVETTMKSCQEIYARLNVELTPADVRGESFYNPLLPAVVTDLKAKGLAIDTEGAVGVFIDGPKKPPLLIQKKDGGYLYGTTDLAGVRFRVSELHAKRIMIFTDSRQALHFSQVFKTAQAAGWADGVSLEHAPFGTILGEDGKPFKTRSGENVKLKDLLDESEERSLKIVTEKNPELPDDHKARIARAVGIGAVKYFDLNKDRTSDYMFKWDLMLAMEGNTAPYLQYAHARVCSIFRKANESTNFTAPITLDAPEELSLAKHILRLTEVVDQVARELKPHHLCSYLYELATRFSRFFENCPVLKSEEPMRSSRLALCSLTARTLKKSLELLGIDAPEQM